MASATSPETRSRIIPYTAQTFSIQSESTENENATFKVQFQTLCYFFSWISTLRNVILSKLQRKGIWRDISPVVWIPIHIFI